eukprot:gnl/MRDRNA2_/MRDRNA2_89525_c0_seq1.p1 gnl/MRDRNA2_/MRDRNA2_89525_c0~~gnl/MRDRNA2_/MRDRNA2_89525_c0_seq1.p1  ORF type:complete len:351 (+),score=100.38 gnl/MRDRNA2_/MRDRNA2_89525_c0_seq1:102-1154(+)
MSLGVGQKKRLEAAAKLGLAPSGSVARKEPERDFPSNMPRRVDKRTIAMERERKFREQEDQDSEEDRMEAKKPKVSGGLQRLGPVLPREDRQEAPVPRPPPPKPGSGGMMQLRVSADTAERLRSSALDAAGDDDDDDYNGQPSARHPLLEQAGAHVDSSAAERQRRLDQEAKEAKDRERKAMREREKLQRKREEEEEQQRKRRKKKKKKKRKSSSEESEEDSDDDEDENRQRGDRPRVQYGGLSSKFMTIECPKGKMSKANEGFTDADLERRFGSGRTSSSGLMSEDQVKNMLAQQKRKEAGKTESAANRVKRELEEWRSVKEMRNKLEKLKGPEEEHLVYSSERWMAKY